MTTLAVVPVKFLDQAKSRLSPALPQSRRSELSIRWLSQVLDVLRGCEVIAETAVVSPDPRALDIVRRHAARPLLQRSSGLNPALREGRAWANSLGAESLLVLLPDLPLLTVQDVRSLVAALPDEAGVVLAPDRHGTGTNAMLLRPPSVITMHFGPASFSKHLHEAEQHGLAVQIVSTPGTQWDMDTPADLAALEAWQRTMDAARPGVRCET